MWNAIMTDSELLQRYADSRCEEAFTELVRRHINFVYSAALRQAAGDAHLAQDVAQSVFIDLARKGASLSRRTVLTGWLYTSTRYAAAKAVRTEQRRHAREEESCFMQELSGEPAGEAAWEELQPVLDQAMHELNERDRNALLLRYFEGRHLAEVGAQLGLSEDAARMCVSRAVDKLRQMLTSRGVTSSTAALTTLLATQTVTAAPAGLALNVAGAAFASAASTSTLTLFNIMATTKLKIALVTAAVVAVATPLALQHHTQGKLREQNQSLRREKEHLAGVAAENARLSNLLAQAADRAEPAPDDRSVELLKLRGEVARLREESRELARLKSGNDSGHDPSIESTLRTLGTRATQLKRHLEQMPARGIPELGLIGDKEWIDAVAKNALETDEDYRQALNSLRSSGKQRFGNMMQKALKKYALANDGMLPSELSQLQPYMERPVDPTLFQRYQLTQSGRLADAPANGHNLIAEIALPADEDYDSRFTFGLNGTSSHSVNRSTSALETATRAYARANNGLLPRDPAQLAPYLQQPVDPGRVQNYLNSWPPNITTLEHLQVYRR
jgi:RNA polymerase sigma factor (sigma-70 family)